MPAEPQFHAVVPDAKDLGRVLAAIAAKRLNIPVDRRLPLEQAGEAQALADVGQRRGKTILLTAP
ncbi:hypothetical protein LK12_22505 [Novosphingobium malaysiense]|uniref:Alcohol dehydrogenase n=1 Tax=Novosphingobium malaysiense TaxID=1348853 RepID=A0A0B1ZIH6_9SPHN|nr:hypothetical protein LK12_22505 [Novosphingobium malaysiense]